MTEASPSFTAARFLLMIPRLNKDGSCTSQICSEAALERFDVDVADIDRELDATIAFTDGSNQLIFGLYSAGF